MSDTSVGAPEFLTIGEVASLLRTTPAALYAARHRGQKPGSLGVQVGRKIVWRRSDIDAWWNAELDANTSPRW